MIDQTGVGETFMSMAINSGLENARGIGTVLAEETGCYDFPQALYGGWTSPHTLRHGVHERAQRRALWAGDYRETKVLASTGDPWWSPLSLRTRSVLRQTWTDGIPHPVAAVGAPAWRVRPHLIWEGCGQDTERLSIQLVIGHQLRKKHDLDHAQVEPQIVANMLRRKNSNQIPWNSVFLQTNRMIFLRVKRWGVLTGARNATTSKKPQ